MRRTCKDVKLLACFSLASWAAAAAVTDTADKSLHGTLKVDVCVIGGGAAGTYAAIKSKDLGKTVAVVEQKDRLGGHTHTYTDPQTKKTIELGVAEWQNTSEVRDWFKRFNIPLYKYNYTIPGVTSEDVDFLTGKLATPKQGDLIGAWDAFQKQVAKYPFLDDDLSHIPFPVPDDLLLPFGQFIRKYNLSDAVPYLSLYGQGWGNFVTLPTLLAIKYFPPSFFGPDSLATGQGALAAKNNSLIYGKAGEELGDNVLLSSTVVSMDRSRKNLAKLTVQTPSGKRTIHAKKLISAIPPLYSNLRGYDLNKTEATIFKKFKGHSWYVGLANNTGIPSNLTITNYGTNNNANFNLPILPGFYQIYATVKPGIHYWLFGGNDTQTSFTKAQVKTSFKETVARMQARGTIPKTSGEIPEFIDFSNHSPYEMYASSEDIAKGFYNDLFSLQGQKHTYWTGAAFVTHGSAAIWNFTDKLVKDMWSEQPLGTPAAQ